MAPNPKNSCCIFKRAKAKAQFTPQERKGSLGKRSTLLSTLLLMARSAILKELGGMSRVPSNGCNQLLKNVHFNVAFNLES